VFTVVFRLPSYNVSFISVTSSAVFRDHFPVIPVDGLKAAKARGDNLSIEGSGFPDTRDFPGECMGYAG
jgi:hypothetical protein